MVLDPDFVLLSFVLVQLGTGNLEHPLGRFQPILVVLGAGSTQGKLELVLILF